MNIAIITDSFPPMVDGVSRCALGYANALHNGNYGNVIVITPKIPGLKYDYPFEVYGFPSIPVRYSHYRAGHPFIPYLVRKLKKMNIDIIHAHSPFTSMFLARQLRQLLNVPIVFTQHTKWHFDIAQAVSSARIGREIERYAYSNIKAADEVWAVSKTAGEYLKSRGFSGKYEVVPNGSDALITQSNDSLICSIRKKHKLNSDLPVLLFVGRMLWYKGIALKLETLKLLKDRGFNYHMIFVGDGEDFSDIKAKFSDEGLDDFVSFTGKITDRDELMGYYCVADLFFFLSTYDTQGLVVQEAAAASCPSLVLEETAPSEFLEDGYTGFISKNNPESVADKIEEIFSNEPQIKVVGENAVKHVYMPWDNVIKNAAGRYKAIIHKHINEYRKTVRSKVKRTVKYGSVKAARAVKHQTLKIRRKVIGKLNQLR